MRNQNADHKLKRSAVANLKLGKGKRKRKRLQLLHNISYIYFNYNEVYKLYTSL